MQSSFWANWCFAPKTGLTSSTALNGGPKW
jgi:hypothetical protein